MPAATAAFHSEGAATTAAETAATLGPPSWRDGAGGAAVAKLQLECVLAITLRIFHIAPAADAAPPPPPPPASTAAVEEGAPEL